MKGATQGQITIGMFIINENGEIFLRQQHDTSTGARTWNIPCLLHEGDSSTVYAAAQDYMQSLGLHGELHEVFGRDHSFIALTNFSGTEFSSGPIDYAWHDLHHIVRDTRERPAHYSSLLKTSLEGIVLYLKTHLKNSLTVGNFTRFEL